MGKRNGPAGIASALSIALLAACDNSSNSGSDDGDTAIKVGVFMNLTVSGAAGTQDELYRTFVLAAKEINEAGGINGRKMELVPGDSKRDTASARLAARYLIDTAKVDAIVGGQSSATTLVASSEAIRAGIPLITSGSTSTAISYLEDQDLVWRTVVSDKFQGKVAATLAKKTFGASKAAILYRDNAYGAGLAKEFKTHFAAQGGTIAKEVHYSDDSASGAGFDGMAKRMVDTLLETPVDLVYLVSFDTEPISVAKHILAKTGAEKLPILLGCDGNAMEQIRNWDVAWYSKFFSVTVKSDERGKPFQTFSKNFQAHTGFSNPGYPTAYDALYLLGLAMAKASSTRGADVAAALPALSGTGATGATKVYPGEFQKALDLLKQGGSVDYDGASGTLEFDAAGDVTDGYYMCNEYSTGDAVVKAGFEYIGIE
ncbi:MAG TPA: ABC transporter substrate-binding protein [Fibrobacteria bacterium]|nr:ABC transporter substrate-binding protein [Fibrobacteria bacterium]